jgi:regulator of protease activity HflC (stomatin/prohibitin superfamily)
MFITAIIFLIVAVIGLAIWIGFRRKRDAANEELSKYEDETTRERERMGYSDSKLRNLRNASDNSRVGAFFSGIGTAIFGGLALLFFFLGSFYTQDAGQAVVQKDWAGNLVGVTTETGWHWKAPWVDTIAFDIRDQRITFVGPSEGSDTDYAGGTRDGAQITVQDKDKVSSNVDITVTYSIVGKEIIPIYSSYKDEEGLRALLLVNDIREMVRGAANEFTTDQLLGERDKYADEIARRLVEKWKADNIVVENVSLQEIRPPENVKQAYSDAQQAETNIEIERNKLSAAEVSAQQQIVQAQAEADAARVRAQGQADANATLNASLTPSVLQQRYIDALNSSGSKWIVPNDANVFLNAQ